MGYLPAAIPDHQDDRDTGNTPPGAIIAGNLTNPVEGKELLGAIAVFSFGIAGLHKFRKA